MSSEWRLEMPTVPLPAVERKWVRCPHCGAKVSIFDNTAECHGVFLKCTRGCKKTFELVIRSGKQIDD